MAKKESYPYQKHSDTSKAAADGVVNAGTQRHTILEWLREHGPAIDEEIQDELGINPNAERPRRVELKDFGFIRDSGKRRLTKSGHWAVLWEVVEQPQAAVNEAVVAQGSLF